MNDLQRLARRLDQVASEDAAGAIVEVLADVWVARAKRDVRVDTGQTRARTAVTSIKSGRTRATAELMSDTPYAGFIEYGTRYMSPVPYFRNGRDQAAQEADRFGARIESQLVRALTSGGSWNPRSL